MSVNDPTKKKIASGSIDLAGYDAARLTLQPSDLTYSATIPSTIVGPAERRYQVLERFFKRPIKWTFVEVADVAVDANDNVFVFTQSAHTVMIFDKHGNFLDSWGDLSDSFFSFPHGITVGPDGVVYTADVGSHTVRMWTPEGRLLRTLGIAHRNAPEHSGEPFNKPTKVAVASNGDVYVSDGYRNSHIHCFDPSGELKFSWGAHGSGPGEFDLPHGLFIDRSDGDKVYVADRFNDRIQIFAPDGTFLAEWGDLILPCAIAGGPDGTFAVAELYQRVSILDRTGTVLARWGDEGVPLETSEASTAYYQRGLPSAPARRRGLRGFNRVEPGPGRFSCPHGIAVDSEGSVYVAETPETRSGLDRGDRSIQKFIRI